MILKHLLLLTILCTLPSLGQSINVIDNNTFWHNKIEQLLADLVVDPIISREPFSQTDTIPTVYLTFDDGPSRGTFIIADAAYKAKIPITFFMVGLHLKEASPTVIKKYNILLKNPLAQILNHSYSHGFRNKYTKYYKDVLGATKDIEKCQDYMKIKNKIVRLPGSNIWKTPLKTRTFKFESITTLVDTLFAKGYNILGWDVEWHFNYNSLQLKESYLDMLEKINYSIRNHRTIHKNHLIILMHDRSFIKTESLEQLIKLINLLKSKGYRLAFASNHPTLNTTSLPLSNISLH